MTVRVHERQYNTLTWSVGLQASWKARLDDAWCDMGSRYLNHWLFNEIGTLKRSSLRAIVKAIIPLLQYANTDELSKLHGASSTSFKYCQQVLRPVGGSQHSPHCTMGCIVQPYSSASFSWPDVVDT